MTEYPLVKSMKAMQSGVVRLMDMMAAYRAARAEADALRVQVAEAARHGIQRQELEAENQRLRKMLNFVREEPLMTLEPVEVLGSSKGIIVIDQGTMHGMQESLCALTTHGILGYIKQVDPLTSNIVTLHNPECKVGAMIKRNRVRGIVTGSGSDLSPMCTMEYIDIKDDVRQNDEVVTSPESKFPVGYAIGKVVAVHATGSLWKVADIEPIVDPYRVDEIFILRKAAVPLKEIEITSTAAPEEPAKPALPQSASPQEQYAP